MMLRMVQLGLCSSVLVVLLAVISFGQKGPGPLVRTTIAERARSSAAHIESGTL